MQVEFSVADLATVAGCGAVTLVILQLLLKPVLDGLGGSANFEKWRPLMINGTAVVLAVLLAVLAQAVTGISYESGLQAVLTGLGGAVVATAGYEAAKNTIQVFR